MVIVTHELGFAREVADEVLFFDEGVIVERGAPAALFTAPKKERTRRFLDRLLRPWTDRVTADGAVRDRRPDRPQALRGLSSVELTAAVSAGGGLGSFGLYGYAPERIHDTISRLRAATDRPIAVNLWWPRGVRWDPPTSISTRSWMPRPRCSRPPGPRVRNSPPRSSRPSPTSWTPCSSPGPTL